MSKSHEYSWCNPDGITHHIDTRRVNAYRADARTGTCGVDLRQARRVRFDAVDCMTCIVRVARRPRLPPRPAPDPGTPSWWTIGGERHACSANNPWRAVCGESLRAAQGNRNPPNCVACGATPRYNRSWRTPDGTRHTMRFSDLVSEKHAPCGAGLVEAQIVRKAPNCVECRAVETKVRRVREGRNRG